MRMTITVDSVDEDQLRVVLNAHRIAMSHDATPTSIEATNSREFNNAALVAICGTGYNVRTVALSPIQTSTFLANIVNPGSVERAE